MNFLHALSPLYPVSGFIVGLLVGLTGVGGGSLMTPLLILVFGIHPAAAVGTDLLYASMTKSVGTMVHGASRTVDWRITGLLAAGSVPATCITLAVLGWSNAHGGSTRLISAVLGVALILTALSLVFRARILAWAEARFGEMAPGRVTGLTVLTGAVLGILVSLSSVGAGALGVTALLLLYPRMRTARLIGSDIAHAVPLTLVAGLGHWAMGSVDLNLLGALLIGSVPGICIGSYFAARVPDAVLRPIMATLLLFIGGRLVL